MSEIVIAITYMVYVKASIMNVSLEVINILTSCFIVKGRREFE